MGDFEIRGVNSPTCPKFNTHKKVVVHFFIPMLLIPKTPPLTYPKIKKFKGPKTDHFTFHFHSSLIINFCRVVLSYLAIDEHGGRGSIAGIKESFAIALHFTKEIPLKIFGEKKKKKKKKS